MRAFVTLAVIASFFPTAQAIPLGDGIYLALPPETIQCVDIFLPDSAGVLSAGLVEYEITSDAGWGDLTEQRVQTDENNTVKVPLCFRSFGIAEGQCSAQFTLTIAAPALGVSKTLAGGTCVSRFPDVEHGPPGNPRQVLNGQADIFDLAFSSPVAILPSQGPANLTLLLESYASVTLDLTTQGLSPATATVALSPQNPRSSFTFTASQAGPARVTATIRGCEGAFCSKHASAEVRVQGQTALAGFTAFLFPSSLDVKELAPVRYELVLTSFGREREFSVELALPPGLSSNFIPQNLTFQGERTLTFSVTPANLSSLYEIVALVSSEGNQKEATATLSTNELLTDAVRAAEAARAENPGAGAAIQGSLDQWYQSYQGSAAGTELDDYTAFQKQLDQARSAGNETPAASPAPQPEGPNFLLLGGAVAAIVIIALVAMFLRKPRKKTIEGLEELEEER